MHKFGKTSVPLAKRQCLWQNVSAFERVCIYKFDR